jgi:transcription elongation factor GreA
VDKSGLDRNPLPGHFFTLYNVPQRSSASPDSAYFLTRVTQTAVIGAKIMSDPLAKIKRKLQLEIDAFDHELNVDLPKEIAIARAHGDLSENAEYKYAKERQGFVNAKLGALKKRLGDLGMLNLSNIPTDRTGFGSRVTVLDVQRNAKIEYKLVSSEEADVERGLISTTSPIGRALLNRKVGDEVQVNTPNGTKEFEIVSLLTIHDEE